MFPERSWVKFERVEVEKYLSQSNWAAVTKRHRLGSLQATDIYFSKF